MFTGIITATGSIDRIEHRGGDRRYYFRSAPFDWDSVAIGDSIAVSGVCLTVVEKNAHGFCADVSVETISRTLFSTYAVGTEVNLEPALTLATRLGGHLVSGHVDGIAEVVDTYADGRSQRFSFRVPSALAKYIAEKGSICIDGISLTVNAVRGDEFDVNIVPHTLAMTTMKHYRIGSQVNLEVDLIARYLERLMLGDRAAEKTPGATITEAFLASHGFIGKAS